MKRIAKRIVGSFVYGVLVCGAVSACASEETSFRQDASAVCNPAFCLSLDMMKGCCLSNGACGVNLGNGCVPAKKDSGN